MRLLHRADLRDALLSRYTVQEHLCSAFDKVGVQDRQALVKRLFFDNISPLLG